jgi:hypothetical protein
MAHHYIALNSIRYGQLDWDINVCWNSTQLKRLILHPTNSYCSTHQHSHTDIDFKTSIGIRIQRSILHWCSKMVIKPIVRV